MSTIEIERLANKIWLDYQVFLANQDSEDDDEFKRAIEDLEPKDPLGSPVLKPEHNL